MGDFTFASVRKFFVASYAESHGLLLVRARRDPSLSTRVDILFQDVRAMEMRLWTNGLTIQEVGLDMLAKQASAPLALAEPGAKAYLLSGEGWQGYVLGGIIGTLEDNGDPSERSPLLGSLPT
ncbi:MAG: hypothetical protein KA105_02985 [Caulobacter sp.]|nr:hypothetical protein [Caulobacter sp.]